MTAVPEVFLLDDLVSPDPDVDGLAPTTLARVLGAACRSAGLTTLELRVVGRPALATLVRRPPALRAQQVVVWPTQVAAGTCHEGFLLVASAPTADERRRAAVADAAVVVGELLQAEHRRLQAERVAGLDPLTQLGNRRTWRRALEEESARALRYSSETAVVVVDLDGLKRINDGLGHGAGDEVLLRTSEAVRAASRSVDIVCRLGGDEFAVLAPETGAEGAERLAERLREELARAGVKASIGVATKAGGGLEEVWHEADRQMYQHKRRRTLI